ncbi:DUF768 domain-containing protein [Mesorhizobium loti]|uniref:DUF768 domain-containing protein n=1 Tax=Rhizobium loti TaxID=381 RepID=UPI0003FCAACE|nr:DUF768 domain-containing protein [Mesorhizobium loti]
MSTRGINFLDEWIRNNVPETTKADGVDELTHKLFADAKALGIKCIEINEETPLDDPPPDRLSRSHSGRFRRYSRF